MAWTNGEIAALENGLNKVLEERRYWPNEETFRLAHQILPIPATEVAVVRGDGKLLLEYRTFQEWPVPYNKPGWYIPGGYRPWGADFHTSCLQHLRKDLAGEYRRVGLPFDMDNVRISIPSVIGSVAWMPGEHPFGSPVSLLCVCELLQGDIIETDWLQWSDKTIETDVPRHQKLQDMIFRWLNSTPEQRAWLKELHALGN